MKWDRWIEIRPIMALLLAAVWLWAPQASAQSLHGLPPLGLPATTPQGLPPVAGERTTLDLETARRSDELARLRAESLATRRAIHTEIVSSGVVSIVAGALMTVTDDYDQGIRFAGINTMAFGAVNTVVGSLALHGINEEERTFEADAAARRSVVGFSAYREHAVADESREAWGHGINLGLAAAYGALGTGAIVTSQLGVDHPNRWLGSGIAISVQAAHLLVVDLIGTMEARRFETEMRAITPLVSFDPRGGTQVGATWGQRF